MSSLKYSVVIYPSAEQDLLEIKEYFENILKTSANNLFQKFYESIDILETNPFIYPLIKDTYLNQLGYRFKPIDNFLLFYIIDDTEVQIHRFFYGKRDYLLFL
ncbi:MAG TPA: type II toxin-antitoxin system RelE/ParE family toxin [Treponema sp.]|nr:type II toxin-antitoxin system RelE/ParE family toxin [Treponema sp.]